jgi:hypothetical protein
LPATWPRAPPTASGSSSALAGSGRWASLSEPPLPSCLLPCSHWPRSPPRARSAPCGFAAAPEAGAPLEACSELSSPSAWHASPAWEPAGAPHCSLRLALGFPSLPCRSVVGEPTLEPSAALRLQAAVGYGLEDTQVGGRPPSRQARRGRGWC